MPGLSRTFSAVVGLLLGAGCVANAPPELTLNRDHLDFGVVEVGGTYRLSLALSNYGDSTLVVKGLQFDPATPDVEFEGLPLDEVSAGGREVLTLVYRPTSEGSLGAVLRIDAADSKTPREISVTGQAVQLGAVVRAMPGAECAGLAGSLDFGTVTNGAAGVRQLTVESTGTGTIAMIKAVITPEDAGFSVEGLGDGLFLAPGQLNTLTVRYDPTRPGPQSGVITLETNSFLVPRLEIPLCGTGMVSALCATPESLTLGDVAPGTSASSRLTLSSCGNLPVTVRTASIVPDPTAAAGFSLFPLPTLPRTLDPGQSAAVDVVFDAASARTARSHVRFTSSSPVTPELLVPAGANLPPPCNATVGASVLRFYKDLAPTQSLSLTNNGSTDCLIERIDILPVGSDFVLERQLDLPAVLAARSTMDLPLTYIPSPNATTTSTATLEIELDWVHDVVLRGDPRPPTGCHLIPQTPVIDFGLITSGGMASRSLTLTNVGSDPCVVHGITFDRPGFTAHISTTAVAAQSRTTVLVSYTTQQVTTLTARMTISSSDKDQPQRVVPVITGHIRCDPNCACTAAQTPTYWSFSDQWVSSAITPSTGLGALQESCDPKRCPDGQVAVEVDRGVLQCVGAPPTCPDGQGLELQGGGEGWGCVPCPLVVQYGGLFAGQRACAPRPTMSCGAGTVPTFDAKARTWSCVATCNNGAYDQRTLPGSTTLVCVPC